MPLILLSGPRGGSAIVAAGSWADTIVGMSGLGAALGTNGQVAGLDITGSDYGARADTEGGASLTYFSSGAYDNTGRIRMRPPSIQDSGGPNQTYCGIANGANLWNSGANDIAQINIGWCAYVGARYVDLGADSKTTGVLIAQTLGGATGPRAAVFDGDYATSPISRIFCVTANTVQSYHQPVSGVFDDTGPDTDKLLFIRTSANHANNPPICGQEWLYFEQELDVRQNRGNANGRNRLDVWARDGYLGYLEIPLNHDAGWSFANDQIATFEYLGGLFNLASTAHDDNYVDFSHLKFSANRSVDDRMEPPPGFLT